MLLSLVIFAQDRGEQQPPDPGSGLPIIAIVLGLIVLGAIILWAVLARGSRKSKGGVSAPPSQTGEPHPGSPPLESVEPRS